MSIRLATFNVENLLTRFDFSGYRNNLRKDRALHLVDIKDEAEYRLLERARTIALTDDTRQQTALAIAETEADLICLQEIEDEQAIDAFEFNYLFRMLGEGYRAKHASRGNDGRGIDVGFMARQETADGDPIEIDKITSHATLTYGDLGLMNSDLAALDMKPDDRIFKRDCLMVDFHVGGRPLTLFIVHFKSMGGWRDGLPGREYTMPIRMAEAAAVREIVKARFRDPSSANWAICGDCNDYQSRIIVGGDRRRGFTFEPGPAERSSVDRLTEGGFAVNVVERLPLLERWTLEHQRGKDERHLCQLDYILLSPKLAADNPNATPEIVRGGLPWRVAAPEGQIAARYPRIGWDRPKASDHCPVAITLSVR